MSPALPRRRKSARRAEILAAAREVFLALPYEQASIGQIAQRAGCVVGTIYGYFENKRDLFDAVLTDFYDALIADIEPKFALLESTADRLRYLVARHLQITLDEASWLHVFAREALSGEGYFGSPPARAEPALHAVSDAHHRRRQGARRAASPTSTRNWRATSSSAGWSTGCATPSAAAAPATPRRRHARSRR